MPASARGAIRIKEFLEEGIVPSHFWEHEYMTGALRSQCVFCLKPVSDYLRDKGGYHIELEDLAPSFVSRNDVELEKRKCKCTICINCDSDISDFYTNERPADSVETIYNFIYKGKYPQNIVSYSLRDDASHFCFLCSNELVNSNSVIHYLPTGYYRNQIESNLIPGPLMICGTCDEEIDRARRVGEYKWPSIYHLDTCSRCKDEHFIDPTEAEYRLANGTKGKYLCPECALAEDLMGKRRIVQPVCRQCDAVIDNSRDILLGNNYQLRIDNFLCNSCENAESDIFTFDINENGRWYRVEVYHYTPKQWLWQLIEAVSTNAAEDTILKKSKISYETSYAAMFAGVQAAWEAIDIQLKLDL